MGHLASMDFSVMLLSLLLTFIVAASSKEAQTLPPSNLVSRTVEAQDAVDSSNELIPSENGELSYRRTSRKFLSFFQADYVPAGPNTSHDPKHRSSKRPTLRSSHSDAPPPADDANTTTSPPQSPPSV